MSVQRFCTSNADLSDAIDLLTRPEFREGKVPIHCGRAEGIRRRLGGMEDQEVVTRHDQCWITEQGVGSTADRKSSGITQYVVEQGLARLPEQPPHGPSG